MSNNPNPNPNHQKLLDLLPGELHPIVIPILKEWDQGVNDQFAKIHSQYDELKPFKALVENNIDPSLAVQAVNFTKALEADPETVLKQVNEHFDLGYVSKDEVQAPDPNDEDPDFMNDDIFKDPRVKALADGLTTVQQQLKTQQEQEQQQAAIDAFEAELDVLEKETTEKGLPFNRTFVTALCAQGFEKEEALSQFHQVLAAQSVGNTQTEQQPNNPTNEQPPVVLGGSPAGSGLPDGSVKFGTLAKNDLNATIEQMLQQSHQSGQG